MEARAEDGLDGSAQPAPIRWSGSARALTLTIDSDERFERGGMARGLRTSTEGRYCSRPSVLVPRWRSITGRMGCYSQPDGRSSQPRESYSGDALRQDRSCRDYN